MMDQPHIAPATDPPRPGQAPSREEQQVTRAIVACFLVSGAVGLLYEVLWIRMLGLVFGHTVFAITTVLAAFMGGLALGSLLFGRLADRTTRQVRLYGLLEIGIGAYCALLPLLLDGAQLLYLGLSRSLALPFLVSNMLQFALVAGLLVPPTCLMGATLPLLVRFFVREEATLGRQVGLLYSVNTWGAVGGTLLAGYLLVPALGIRTTLWLAVVANLGIGTLILVFDRHLQRLAADAPGGPAAAAPAAASRAPLPLPLRAVAIAFGVSGAASMVYEVTWSRTLTLVIGSSTYAFTAMLVAFLCGIAGGSWAFAALAGRRRIGPAAFGWLQLAIGLAALLLIPAFGRLPVWFLELFQLSQAPNFMLGVQLLLSLLVMLVPTLLIGATFPCAVRAVTSGVERVGADTGWLYAVNTGGAILGTVLAGFAGVPLFGVQWTMRAGVWLNLAAGLAVLLCARSDGRRLVRAAGVGTAAVAATVAALLPAWDPALMASGVAIYGHRYMPLLRAGEFGQPEWQPEILYYRDGISATVSIHRDGPRLFLRVNGKTDAGNATDMHTQLFSGHIPMLLHPGAKRVLVIGLGSGVTAGAVAQHPVDRIDVIEIEPAVVEAARFFAAENRNVLADPRVRLVVTDGRNFLENVREPYDVIISEPSNPWIRGLATLFTREFFALAQSRLAPGGLMLQWIQGYGIAPDDLRMVARTFLTAFPHSSLWTTVGGDNFLLGASVPTAVPLGRIQERVAALAPLREDFARVGFSAPASLLADLVLGPAELRRYAGAGPLNTDDTLPLEFSTPRSLYEIGTADLNDRILRSYRSPGVPLLGAEDRARLATTEIQHALGMGFLAKGLPAEAEAAFLQAAHLDGAHGPSRLQAARLLIQRGMVLPALRLLEEAERAAPRDAIAAQVRGLAFQQQGMGEEALAAFQRAVGLAPNDAESRQALARALRDRGRLAGARVESDALLLLAPGNPDAMTLAAEIRLAQGDAAAVTELLRPALETDRTFPISTRAKFRHLTGSAQLQARQLDHAIVSLETAARLNPVDAGIRLDLSRAYELQGNGARALEVLDRLLVIHPNHLPALQRAEALAARLEATP
jgi:spermidine synthase